MKIRLSYILFIIIVLPILSITGCNALVYDNLNYCPGVNLAFSYKADDGKEHLQEYMKSIDVFIYDKNNNSLIKKYRIEGEDLKKNRLDANLGIGEYKIVAIGNVLSNTVAVGYENYEKGIFSRKELVTDDGKAKATYDRLYFGSKQIVVSFGDDGVETVELFSKHIKIHAEVLCGDKEGEQAWYTANKDAGYRLTLGETAARVDFLGKQKGKASFDFNFDKNEGAKRFKLDFNTLRFDNKEPLIMTLWQNDKALYSFNIADFIKENDLNISGKQETVLNVFFKQNFFNLLITVKPWEAVDVVPITE